MPCHYRYLPTYIRARVLNSNELRILSSFAIRTVDEIRALIHFSPFSPMFGWTWLHSSPTKNCSDPFECPVGVQGGEGNHTSVPRYEYLVPSNKVRWEGQKHVSNLCARHRRRYIAILGSCQYQSQQVRLIARKIIVVHLVGCVRAQLDSI